MKDKTKFMSYILIIGAIILGLMGCRDVETETNSSERLSDTSKGLEYNLTEAKDAYVVVGIGTYEEAELVIPETYKGLPVIAIGEWAFSECYNLTSAIIPDSVTEIGAGAFYRCIRLTDVSFSKNVTCIKEKAFENCSCLTEVWIPSSVTEVGDSAFSSCNNLEDIYLSDFLQWCTIDWGNEDNLPFSSYNVALHIESIPNEVVIPNGTTIILDEMFYGCDNLVSIKIPDTVTEIGRKAFYDCDNLTSIIIPDSVKDVNEDAFQECDNLGSIYCESMYDHCGNWSYGWMGNCKANVYWGDEWEYVNGVPTIKQ